MRDDDTLDRLAAADPLRDAGAPGEEDRAAADALLARIVASPPAAQATGGVARRRDPRRHGVGRAAAVALAAVALLCAVVLADPLGDDGDSGVLEQALAAVGDGPVLHVVTETDVGATLLDLRSSRRRPLLTRYETWFDPRRGQRSIYSFGGRVLGDFGTPIGKRLPGGSVPEWLELFTRDYRDALRSGRAEVLREGKLDGTAVYWIRIPLGRRAGRMLNRDVAISRETYEPLYLDSSVPQVRQRALERIVEVESLSEAAIAIPGPELPPPVGFDIPSWAALDRAGADRLLGGRLALPGRQIGGLRLGRVRSAVTRTYVFGKGMRRPRYRSPEPTVRLLYGSARDVASGAPPSSWDPVLAVQAARRSALAATLTPQLRFHDTLSARPLPGGYVPPAGTVAFGLRGHQAVLRRHGVVIAVTGSSPSLVRAGVRAVTR